MKFVKIDNFIYEIQEMRETWYLKVYDYPSQYLQNHYDGDRKSHRVYASDEADANRLKDSYYNDNYKDMKIEVAYVNVNLLNIVTNETTKKEFLTPSKKDGGELMHLVDAKQQYNSFLKEHMNFTDNDLNLIFRYKEMLQKDRHNREIVEQMQINARLFQKETRMASGMPLDLC
jgi:hypothetical protein